MESFSRRRELPIILELELAAEADFPSDILPNKWATNDHQQNNDNQLDSETNQPTNQGGNNQQ